MSIARLVRLPRRVRASVVVAAMTVASTGAIVALAGPASAATTFSNTSAISVADANGGTGAPGTGSLYPSNIVVSGQSGTISHLSVTLNSVSHPFAGDFDVLLVGPNGAKFEVVSDAGNGSATSNVTATFDDAAASALSSGGNWGAANSGVTVKPSNVDSGSADVFPSPAPAGPYLNPNNGTFLGVNSQSLDAAFGGLSPNGTWSLYVVDDTSGDFGSIAGGWALNVTAAALATTTTTVAPSVNPSTTGSSVTFSAHVVDNTSANVTTGTVTFKDGGIGGTTLASGVALNGSGVASFSTSSLGEGAHTITAIYSGTASFATSNGSMTQVVDNPTTQSGNTFSNSGAVTVNDFNVGGGAGFPYPSHITVSGLSGAISNVTVALMNVSHPDIDDVDAMLVGPGGQKLIFVSDAGSASSATSNATMTFDDGAANQVGASGPWTTGTFRPTDYNAGADAFPSPAPTGASAAAPQGPATLTSVFGGTNPNGQWSLYVADDGAGGAGSIAGGWALSFITSSDAATTTTVTSSQNPSTTGSSVTFTAHVTDTSSSNVTVGTVTFRDGATVIGSPTPLSAAGTAAVSTAALSEGAHTITASYSGVAGSFNLSTGTTTQQVDGATVVSGATYCNNGGLAIQSAVGADLVGTASVYPSHITVSGASGNLVKLTASIKGLTHAAPDDVDVLLVSPTGTTVKLMSDTGGLNTISGVNLTIDDAAASLLPDSSTLSSGTYRPSDYEAGDTFPSPAPSGPYGSPAPVGSATLASFAGGSPNGTWSLYVVDDSAGLNGSITGWCLNLTLPPVANDDSYNAAQDTTLTVPAPGVLANDTGTPAPTAVAISGGSTTQGGTVTLSTNGGFSYNPPAGFTGSDTFTYTATNGPGATDTATVTFTVTHKPSITGGTVARQAGSAAANSTIATVSDVETPAGDLTVTANPPSGISVSNITNTTGTVTGDVRATCAATTGANSVPLTVTDGDGLNNIDNLMVNVTANSAPTLAYGSASVNAGSGTTADPTEGPSDNGLVSSLTILTVSGLFTGTISVDGPGSATPGRVHVTNAGPAGDYPITVRATDNCGAFTDALLTLSVNGAPTVDAGPDQPAVDLATSATMAGSVTDDARAPGNATTTQSWSQDSGPGTATFADSSALDTTVTFDVAGSYVLRLTASDGQLSASDTVTITVVFAPVIHVPADITVTEPSPGSGAAVNFTVTADGFPTPTIVCKQGATIVSSGDTFAAGVHTIDCTATNSAGFDSGSFTITVRSVPVITVPADITVTEPSPGAGAGVSFTVTADGTPTPSIACLEGVNPVFSGDTFAAGVHTINCTATNGVGSDSGSFTITVRSVPVIHVPADITVVENPAGSGTASVPFTVTADGVPTPTIACAISGSPVTSPVLLAIGSHTVDCTATNSVGSDGDSFVITVLPANHPPVPDAGGPYSVAEGASLTLDASGTTDADGDALSYTWDVNGDGTFGDATGVNPTLTWSQLGALGINDGPATFQMKVRVSDGQANGTVTSAAVQLSVTNTAPTASVTGLSDATRGAPLSLSFGALDPSSVDQAAGFDFTIDWGDGSSTGPVHNGSPISRSHTYAHVGVYTVSVTATDKDGGTSVAATKTVTVAGAEVVSGACGGTDLVVGGTSGNDRIVVNPGKAAGTVKVSLNTLALGPFTFTGRVVVLGQDGNDTISFDSKLTVARIVYGGAGADTISGGNGNGIQLGGPGDDHLSSGNGRDIIVGGTGADTITADNGDDVLIAGDTAFDAPTAANQRAWCALQAEWSRTDLGYSGRIAHLNGSVSSGLNGATVLVASGGGRNVYDDAAADSLKGQLGSDWFLMNVTGGVLDTSDATAGEVRTDLS
jgi:subtilisin-like proprotein convertase family protein